MATKFAAPINTKAPLYVIVSVEKPLAKEFVVPAENHQQLCLQWDNGSPKRLKCSISGACALILSLCPAT